MSERLSLMYYVQGAQGTNPCIAGEEGALRLVNRLDVNGYATGTLQLFFEGEWGAVCSSSFDAQDAQVACRQLGFKAGVTVTRRRKSELEPPDPRPPSVLFPCSATQ